MRLNTYSTERSLGYLSNIQLNSEPCHQFVSGRTLVLATSMQRGENFLVVAGKTRQDKQDSKFNSYLSDNKLDNGKTINIAVNCLRYFDNYTEL